MFKTIAIAVATLLVLPLAAVLAIAATKPDTFHVQRSTSINAAPEEIFALINDFQRWGAWSPYEKKDPTMKRIYSGAPIGEGAVYAWDGSGEVGAGRMEITEASPPSRIVLTLDMTRPFAASNVIEFTLEPHGEATNVTWAMDGRAPYLAKVVHVIFDMDSMVGKDFETGLANLKAITEG